jgi:hypothetical protein
MWCVAKLDEEYIARMEDVLGLYEKPLSASEPVVCIDEKPAVLHEDTCTPSPARPGRVARRDYEYKRCGTANVFCGVEPKAGRHFTKVTPTRCSAEFADYLLKIAAHYPAADTIHLVMDNLSTHTQKALVERFGDTAGTWLWDRFTVLHPQTWKLAESGGDGGRHVQPPVPRQTTDRRYRSLAETGSSMEPPRQSGQGHDSVEVHTQTGQKNA